MSLKELTQEIKETIELQSKDKKQTRSSVRDEIRVMKEMLNDNEFTYDLYDKSGNVQSFSPSSTAREMVSTIINNATKMSKDEASQIAEEYKFGNKEAKCMVDISKSYINTYLDTGRKLPLGGTATSVTDLVKIHVEEKTTAYPHKNDDGTWESRMSTIPEHDKIKAISPCPKYLK